VTIALKSLLQQRHLHEYSEFVVEYVRRAKELDLPRHASAPTKARYYRWVGGHIQNLPRGYHCLVLERMFPGWTARELFGHIDPQHAATSNEALFASFAPAVEPAQLAGLWVTCYVFDGTKHHVDLSTVAVTNSAVTARNYPPEPRAEAHASGFRNEIEAGLFGRHLIGRWRNISDTYFYGSLHFAVLPGETMLDGYYTGFLSDSQVVAERWRWVRVEPQSAEGVDVNTVVLGEPRRIYDAIVGRSPFDAPIPLEQLTENP
jgi:hypothetical protein